MRLLLAVLGLVVVAVMVFVAAGLKETTNSVVTYRTSDQVAMAGLGLVLAAGILFLGRSRVDADADGLRVRNVVVDHAVPWSAVRAVRFDEHSPWATLVLTNDDELAVSAVQAADGERALVAVRGLRALLADHQARHPAPRQDLLYPWE
jgi:Bacterial PH domain